MSAYTALSDPLAWSALALLAAAATIHAVASTGRHRQVARAVVAVGWVAFAATWGVLVPHYALVQHSLIEAAGAALAVPAGLYAAREQHRGRDEAFAVARAIAIAGVLYLPFVAVPAAREALVEAVVAGTESLLAVAGYTAPETFRLVSGTETGASYPFRNSFVFTVDGGHPVVYYVELACTGIKSMATFVGVVFAVEASNARRLWTLGIVLPVIYLLNLLRNAFIALAFGQQRLHVAPEVVLAAFGVEDPYLVSYLVADRIVAQGLSLVALAALAWVAIHAVPAVLDLVDEAVRLVTFDRASLRD